MYKTILTAAMLMLYLLTACTDNTHYQLPASPDYAQDNAWYKQTAIPNAESAQADIFYVAPTCVWDWKDTSGRTIHFQNIYDADQREDMRPALDEAARIFGGKQFNFYAPYYRQITMNSWLKGEEAVADRFPYAMGDVKRAFDYYWKHTNKGKRPFVLAGFSQGAKAVVELLKDMPKEVYGQMVAAYVVGYGITRDEVKEFRYIRAAKDSIDTGVTVCYNSVSDVKALSSTLNPGDVCINPLNWKTDGSPAYLNDSVTVRIDTKKHVLVVDKFRPEEFYRPELDKIATRGSFHMQELLFYDIYLKHNVEQRVKAFRSR